MGKLNILLDMDGVIVDFVSAAIEANGFRFRHDDVDRLNIQEIGGVSAIQFWQAIDDSYGFWESLELYPWAKNLIDLVKDFDRDWSFCTTPSNSPMSTKGKHEWLREYIGSDFKRFVFTPQKQLLARPTNLLIDDSDSNVERFLDAGGQAILFPQPWNKNRDLVNDRVGFVRDEITSCIRF